MKNKYLTVVICILSVFGIISSNAQESLSTTGGVFSGEGGNISYTIGQVVYTTNFATTGSVAQGVQQPFEISLITNSETMTIPSTNCRVFPNPTTDEIFFMAEGLMSDSISYELYNLNGKLLESNANIEQKSAIYLSKYKDAVFILKVNIIGEELKSYKLFKIP